MALGGSRTDLKGMPKLVTVSLEDLVNVFAKFDEGAPEGLT